MKDRSYYESKYESRMDEIYREMKKEGVEDNAEEVVGYYLANYGDNALKDGKSNTEDIEMTEQDKKVTEILEQLFR